MLLTHVARRDASRADCTAGSNSAISTAMMAMTTSSSIRVKPRWRMSELPTVVNVRYRSSGIGLRIQSRGDATDEDGWLIDGGAAAGETARRLRDWIGRGAV